MTTEVQTLSCYTHTMQISLLKERTFGESPPVAMCYYVTELRDDLHYWMTFAPNGSHELHDTLIWSQKKPGEKGIIKHVCRIFQYVFSGVPFYTIIRLRKDI